MLAAIERNQRIAPDPIRRLAALLPPSGPVADAVAARLRLSKKQRDRLSCVAERQASDAGSPRALAYREGPASEALAFAVDLTRETAAVDYPPGRSE